MTTSRLILMRHAKSDWVSGAGDDFARPLAERGVRDARRMGQWLAASALLPARIVCSPARRTRETLEHLGEGAGVDLAPRTEWVEALYHSALEVLLDVLVAEAPCPDLLLLGHNPGLEELLNYLAGGGVGGFDKTFPTGAVYVLECPQGLGSLGRRSARLLQHQRPKLLDR